jgi:hypothetical protein
MVGRAAPILLFVTALLPLGCGGDSARKTGANIVTIAEKGADQFELFSLDPDYYRAQLFEPDEKQEKPTKNDFRGWKVLGKTQVRAAETQKKIMAALRDGIAEYARNAPNCFDPRHGIRVVQEGKTTDYVICFACDRVEVYAEGKDKESHFVTGSPKPLLDEVLRKADVPLKKAK